MICFYHLDDDGKCAAALVNMYGIHDSYPDQFIEMNYGFNVPFDKIATDEQVYIVDFSIEPSDMVKLLDITTNVVWIDHHVTAIKKYEKFSYEGKAYQIDGIRSLEKSGCMLTWDYLNQDKHLQIPQVVMYCDDYDTWKFDYPETREFHQGFELFPHNPEDVIWASLLGHSPENRIQHICNVGSYIIRYREKLMSKLIRSYGFESTIDDHRCFVLNQGLISSDDFAEIDKSEYDILVGVIFDGQSYHYSLRSVEADVAEIAVAHGGGGHTHAAGFTSNELLVHKV